MMASVVALAKLVDGNVSNVISSFLYRSSSTGAMCGANTSDIANLSDLDDYIEPSLWVTAHLYEDSMEFPIWLDSRSL